MSSAGVISSRPATAWMRVIDSGNDAEFASLGVAFARFRVSYTVHFAPLHAELDRRVAEILRLVAESARPDGQG